MLSIKKNQGNKVYNWKALGVPSFSDPKALETALEEVYTDLVIAAKTEDEKGNYSKTFTKWLTLLNDAMLLSKHEKLAELDLANMEGLDKQQERKKAKDLAQINKTKSIVVPKTFSEQDVSVTSLVQACKIMAKYLDVLIDNGLLTSRDANPKKSYTEVCCRYLSVTLDLATRVLSGKINKTDERTIKGCIKDFEHTTYRLENSKRNAKLGLPDDDELLKTLWE